MKLGYFLAKAGLTTEKAVKKVEARENLAKAVRRALRTGNLELYYELKKRLPRNLRLVY